MDELDCFSDTRQAALDQRQRDRPAERLRHVARRHEADGAPDAVVRRDTVRADGQRYIFVHGYQPDTLLPVLAQRVVGEQRALADELALAPVARRGDAEIVRHGRAVGVLAGDDEAFLGAHQKQRFRAERDRAERPSGLGHGGEQRARLRLRHRDFIGPVAGEGDTCQPRRSAVEAAFGERHMRQRVVCKVDAEAECGDEVA